MIIFSLLSTLWNLLGDLAASVFSWIAYFAISKYLWRLPFVSYEWERNSLWRFAIPLTVGFVVEHVGKFVCESLANFGIGRLEPDGKGNVKVVPYVVPDGTNLAIWLIWNLTMSFWWLGLIVVILVLIIQVYRARRAHP